MYAAFLQVRPSSQKRAELTTLSKYFLKKDNFDEIPAISQFCRTVKWASINFVKFLFWPLRLQGLFLSFGQNLSLHVVRSFSNFCVSFKTAKISIDIAESLNFQFYCILSCHTE